MTEEELAVYKDYHEERRLALNCTVLHSEDRQKFRDHGWTQDRAQSGLTELNSGL